MDMHKQMQLPEPIYRGKCKLLLFVCIILMAAFFITGFLPYFDYQAGDTVEIRGMNYTVEETEEFSLMSLLGFPDNYKLLKNMKMQGYKEEVFGYKVVNVMDIGPFLFLQLFAVLMTVLILLLKKTAAKAFICVIWGIVGVSSQFINCVFCMGNTFVRPILIVLAILELIVSVACFVLFMKDSRRVSKYLREVSDVYK